MSATSSASTTRRPSLLSQIRVATPCTASWEEMLGDERMRFCNQCALHVYNISAMTPDEAEQLIMRTEGRLCVRLFQRTDGTVVTEDCPKAVARVQRRKKVMAGAVASALAVMASFGASRDECSAVAHREGYAPPERTAVSFTVPLEQPEKPVAKMGEAVAVPEQKPRRTVEKMGRSVRTVELGNVMPIMGGVSSTTVSLGAAVMPHKKVVPAPKKVREEELIETMGDVLIE